MAGAVVAVALVEAGRVLVPLPQLQEQEVRAGGNVCAAGLRDFSAVSVAVPTTQDVRSERTA